MPDNSNKTVSFYYQQRLALDVIANFINKHLSTIEIEICLNKHQAIGSYIKSRDLTSQLQGLAHTDFLKLELVTEELFITMIRRGNGPILWKQSDNGKDLIREAFKAAGYDTLEKLWPTIRATQIAKYGDILADRFPPKLKFNEELLHYCFVVMPFGKTEIERIRWDEVYYKIIKPAVEYADIKIKDKQLKAFRIDETLSPGTIPAEIVEALTFCPVVIADVSDENPNVFYELGIRHSLNSPTILICRDDLNSRVPFDIQDVRHLRYDQPFTNEKLMDFNNRLAIALSDAITHPDRPDSSVSRTLQLFPDYETKVTSENKNLNLPLIRSERKRAQADCRNALQGIAAAFQLYIDDHDGLFPHFETWKTDLEPYYGSVKPKGGYRNKLWTQLRCPAAPFTNAPHYKMNYHLSKYKWLTIRLEDQVPLLFDSCLQQDANGEFPGTGIHPDGYNVLFANMKVKCIQSEYIYRLKWDPR